MAGYRRYPVYDRGIPKRRIQGGTQSRCAKRRRPTTVSATIRRCPGPLPDGMPMTFNADAPARPTISQSDPHLFGEPESSLPRSQNGPAVRPSIIFTECTPFNHHFNPAGLPSWWPLNTSPVLFATQLYLRRSRTTVGRHSLVTSARHVLPLLAIYHCRNST